MYERLSDKEVRVLCAKFNANIDVGITKALKGLDIKRYKKTCESLKNLMIASRRKEIKINANNLSALALSGIKNIKRETKQANQFLHARMPSSASTYYPEIGEIPIKLKTLFKAASILRVKIVEANHFFGGKDRRYFKIATDQANVAALKSETERNVEKYLEPRDYKIVDYKKGYATNKQGKQLFKIGKLMKNNELLSQEFRDDPSRNADNLRIVISRRPEDLIRMSISRAWGSCTAWKNSSLFKENVSKDIAHGTLVAYLVSKNDPEILNPLSRILIKPYRSIDNKKSTVFVPFKTYGIKNNLFTTAVEDIVENELNTRKTEGVFKLDEGVYVDSNNNITVRGTGVAIDEQGTTYHFKNSKLHNENGLAVRHENGHGHCYINGEKLDHIEFDKWREKQSCLERRRAKDNIESRTILRLRALKGYVR